MKFNIKKKVLLELGMEGSEAIMFHQGGKHKVTIPLSLLARSNEFFNPDDNSDFDESSGFELEISVQILKDSQDYVKWIHNGALKNRMKDSDEDEDETESS